MIGLPPKPHIFRLCSEISGGKVELVINGFIQKAPFSIRAVLLSYTSISPRNYVYIGLTTIKVRYAICFKR
jgi:hypothetical protein